MAHRVNSRQRSTSVAFGAKRTLSAALTEHGFMNHALVSPMPICTDRPTFQYSGYGRGPAKILKSRPFVPGKSKSAS
jgi:hypothetical protein